MKTSMPWVLLAILGSSSATAATPTLQERFQNQLCLGRWTLNESVVVETSSTTTRPIKKTRTEDVRREISPVEIEGPRNSSEAGAFGDYMALCNEHGASILATNPNFHSLSLSTNATSTGKKRGKLTYKGACFGSYSERVTVEYWENADFPSDTTQRILSKKTQSQLGLTKSEVESEARFLVASLREKIGTQVTENLTGLSAEGRVRTTEVTKDYTVSGMECSTADHIPASDPEGKASYLLAEMANWERDNYTSCSHPEFKLIAGTLWHIRLADLNGSLLSADLRSKIDEKALLYPGCVLDGDQAPNFDIPLEDDFSISAAPSFAWNAGETVRIRIYQQDADSLSVTYKGEGQGFEYVIESWKRRKNFYFTFRADASFTEAVRADNFEYFPGTDAHAKRLQELIAEIDRYLGQMTTAASQDGLAPLTSFREYLKSLF